MKKLSKNPIDQYFRENLRSPDLEYNKQDWKGLEKMLPKNTKKKSGWWFHASVAAAVALLFISLWLFNEPVINTGEVAKSKIRVSESDKISNVEDESTGISKALSNSRSLPLSPETSSHATKDLQKDFFSSNPGKVSVRGPGDANQIKETLYIESAIPSVPFIGVSNLQHQHHLYASNVNLSNYNVLITPATDQKTNSQNSDENAKSKFSFGLSLSPDINSISKFSESSFGNSVGLAVSYQISPGLSINTAVAYSKKVYSAEPYEYKAPWASSSAGRDAVSIDADCRVLDIPINLSYSIIESPKRTIFASAGVSSYFMLREKYTLIADTKPSGYPAYSNPTYAYSNKNQHLFSVINFSAGISKPVSKQTSLVVEPYMRLPVTGIGQGKVHLKSIGLNLQFKYHFKKSGLSKTTPGPEDAAQ